MLNDLLLGSLISASMDYLPSSVLWQFNFIFKYMLTTFFSSLNPSYTAILCAYKYQDHLLNYCYLVGSYLGLYDPLYGG